MKIVKRYKCPVRAEYTIRINKAGKYFIYHLKKRLNIDCDDFKDARFMLWCLTH